MAITRNINDDNTLSYLFKQVWDKVYPVGAIYISSNATSPEKLFGGKWQKVGTGRTLMGASSDSQLGTTVNSGLPNLTADFYTRTTQYYGSQILFAGSGIVQSRRSNGGDVIPQQNNPSGNDNRYYNYEFDASRVNSIYGASSIVQPPALYVYFWQRTA